MKTKLLFVMNNLHCGGAERALISLLQQIDYERYAVDLLLFRHEGLFLAQLPAAVHLLDEPYGYHFFDMSARTAVTRSLLAGRPDIAWRRVMAGTVFRTEQNRTRSEQRVWKYIAGSMPRLPGRYDAAIGFLEKSPIYYCVDKVNATRKIGFIHSDYDQLGMDPYMDDPYFAQLDYLATVSESAVKMLQDRFPQYREKIVLMHNIVSPPVIRQLAQEEISLPHIGTTIVSTGRLHPCKGFDLAIAACQLLVQAGYTLRWYVIGEGTERPNLEQQIRDSGVEGIFILAGQKDNPYPYIRECDLYVQTSRFEGRCLAITEAKIMHKPIVSTDFPVIHDQLQHEVNGLIVGQSALEIFEGIRRLIDDVPLRQQLVSGLTQESYGTVQEMDKLYHWIG